MKNEKIDVITVGDVPPNVTEIVGSKRIAAILDGLKEEFETIIVDAPPLVISDAYTLASKVDGVILVLEPGQTREEQAKVIKEQFTRAGAKLIGIVFNRVTTGRCKKLWRLSISYPCTRHSNIAIMFRMPRNRNPLIRVPKNWLHFLSVERFQLRWRRKLNMPSLPSERNRESLSNA